MLRKKSRKEKLIYGIVGLGRFGYALALELASTGADLIVLDKDEEKVRAVREFTENAYVVQSLEKQALMETGIQNCDVAVVCIGEHIDTSILTTLHLVSMGISHVVSKATSEEHGEILKKLGAEVVYPEQDMAIRLANRLKTETVLDFVQLSEKINISKILVPKQIIGKSVVEVNLRGQFGLNIIAIENDGNVIDIITPTYVFRENDILFLSGAKSAFLKLSDWAF